MSTVLAPAAVARLRRLRLVTRRRVEGRYAGAHASRRHGTSLDFADYRAYVPGDDPRWVDAHAYARLGRLLTKRFEAEYETALRVVVDTSASMGFGGKAAAVRAVAAGLAAVALAGGDRVRVLLAGPEVDPGPWLRGARGLAQAQRRLAAVEIAGAADLAAALRRARAEGPRGPVMLVSDLLFEGWEDVVTELARGEATLVHLLGRTDVEPDVRGDLRLVDAETGAEVEVAVGERALADYAAARDAWLDAVRSAATRRGVVYARHLDDEPVEDLLAVRLTGLGVLA
ncbi:MAG TPA: DUF58 domain-containing protein [Egibacteraceae bacterium]|jgi:uncharacterized protein (DUF58 family)|nr:DUF58 domain-containing protein [Egibacteraceae bacterium]